SEAEQTLIVTSRWRVRALRGGIEQQNELWLWAPGYDNETELLGVQGRTVTVRSSKSKTLTGLDVGSGAVLWTFPLGDATPQTEAGERPHVVLSWSGRQTVRQETIPKGAAEAPTLPELPPPSDDPRAVRQLPWLVLGLEMDGTRWALVGLAVVLALVGLVIPCRLFYQGSRRASWWRLLLLLAWVGAIVAGVIFLGPEVHFWFSGAAQPAQPHGLRAFVLAVLGLPLLQVIW